MVQIITDSAADFEPWELEQMNIACIPLTVVFGEDEYQENVNLSKERFYELLESSGEFPKTAQASPQILLDMFEEAKTAGEEALYISLSSQLSGTYQTALITLQMAESDACYVFDSQNATGGQRMIVEYAVKLRDEGKSAEQIVSALEAVRERVVLYACMDTLEYLYKGGRINHAVYRLGNLAQVKPILRVAANGSLEVPAKAMGMRKGMDYLCKRLETEKMDPAFPLYVMYTGVRANAESLAQRLRAVGVEIPEQRIINVGAAIGSHIGPNACGLVYIGK